MRKVNYKFRIVTVLVILLLAGNSVFAKPKDSKKSDSGKTQENKSTAVYRGEGLKITIPAPVFDGASENDIWVSQVVQDLMTNGFHNYSSMTVIDRQNEDVIIDEQRRSEDNRYNSDDSVQAGLITQAQLILAIKIIKTSDNYHISMRINDVNTNETKGSFSNQFSLNDLQNGYATNSALLKLFKDLKIQLVDSQIAELSKKLQEQTDSVRSTVNLAKGKVAEQNKNTVEAMAYYIDSSSEEAKLRYKNLSAAVVTGNIRTDAKNEIALRNAWKKNIEDLGKYLNSNLVIVHFPAEPGKYMVTDWNKGLATIPFDITYEINTTAIQVYYEFLQGLNNTMQQYSSNWGLSVPSLDQRYNLYLSLRDDHGNVLGNTEDYYTSYNARSYYNYVKKHYDSFISNDNSKSDKPLDNKFFTIKNGTNIKYESEVNDYLFSTEKIEFQDVNVNDIPEKLQLKLDKVTMGKSYYNRNNEETINLSVIPSKAKNTDASAAAKSNNKLYKEIVPASDITEKEYEIGDIGPAGGIVFWKGSVKVGKAKYHYMEVSPELLSLSYDQARCFNDDKIVTNFWTGGVSKIDGKSIKSAIGGGLELTNYLYEYMEKLGKSSMFTEFYNYSYGGYNDWFLMGEDEIVEFAKVFHEKKAVAPLKKTLLLTAFGATRLYSTNTEKGTTYLYKGFNTPIQPHDVWYAESAIFARFF